MVTGLVITTLSRDFRKWAYFKKEPERIALDQGLRGGLTLFTFILSLFRMKKVSFQGRISDKCRSVRLALNVKNVVKMLPSNLWRALVSHAWTAYINFLLVDEQMLYYSDDSQRDLISNNYPFPTPPCRPVGKA